VKEEEAAMEVTVNIPDDLAKQMESRGDIPRKLLEAFALEGIKSGDLTAYHVGRLLGFETRMEVDGFLKVHGVYLDYTEDELDEERDAVRSLLSSSSTPSQ
jgi:hypothetical protein